MSVTRIFLLHTDPGHAWLEVSLTEYPEARQFASNYSYTTNGIVYLEEDCDAPAFLNSLTDAGKNYRIEARDSDKDHWIRGLQRASL